MANLDEIQIKISQDSSNAGKAIDSLIASLEKLEKVSDLQGVAAKIDTLSSSLQGLAAVSKDFNAGDLAKQLENIPNAIKGFGELPVQDMQQFANTIQSLTDVLQPLADTSKSITPLITVLSLLPSSALKTITKNTELANSNKKTQKSFEDYEKSAKKTLKVLAGWGIGIKVAGKYIAETLKLATEYTQTVNMLKVTMGEGAKEAQEFADKLGETLGINPADVMNFQATFQNLLTGFGNASNQAQIMSKNLTQLSYDMAAFYAQLGGDAQAAAEKLRLGMAGTIEPIQRLGYAIKEADLKAVAARQGLNINVRNLNTASKSMLRYIAIMEQSTHVQGYLTKSYYTPSTAIMLFKSSIKQLATEIGKVFLPILVASIPYIQAFVKAVINAVQSLITFLGIEVPTINWEENKNGIANVGEEAEEAGKKIQKAFTLGIDELNVLDNTSADAANGMQDITENLSLPEYDMLKGFDSQKVGKQLVEPFEEILKLVGLIGIGIAAWKVGGDIVGTISELNNQTSEINKLEVLKKTVGLTFMVSGVALDFSGAYELAKGEGDWKSVISMLLGSALTLGGSLLFFGLTPTGWAVGIGLAIAATVTGLTVGATADMNEKIDSAIKEAIYGNGGKVTITDLTDKFSGLINEITRADQSVIESGEKMKEYGEKAKIASQDIDTIATALSNGYESANINIPKLNSKFEELATNTKTLMDETYDNIINAVSGSLNQALIDAGVSIPQIVEEISKIKGETDKTYNALVEQYEEISKKLQSGQGDAGQYAAKLVEISQKMQDIVGVADPLEQAFKGVDDALLNIDWESETATNNAFEILRNSVSNAETDIKNFEESIKTTLETLRAQGLDEATIFTIEKALGEVTQEQRAKVQEKAEEYAYIIQTDLINSIDRVAKRAGENYEELSSFTKFFVDKASYVENSVRTYEKDYIQPIEGRLKDVYKTVGSDASVWATEASAEIIKSVFNPEAGGAAYVMASYQSSLETKIKTTLGEIKRTQKPEAEEAGKNIILGLSEGIENNLDVANNSISMLANGSGTKKGLVQTFTEQLGIHSPSTVFAEFGMNIDQGLANGITDNTSTVTDAMTSMLNELLNKIEGFTDKMRNALNDTLRNFARSMSSISIEDGSVSYDRMPKITIPRFANGGYPTSGEMFFAREDGLPEMVGRVGRQTAVMNNGQIADTMAQSLVRALGQGGASQQPTVIENKLYLDGEVVYNNQQKIQRSKGYNLGMGVFANV